MTALHSLALGTGYLVLALIAAWGLFIAVVGAVHVLDAWLSEAPTGTSKVRSSELTDASAPQGGPIKSRDGLDHPAPLSNVVPFKW